MAETFQISQFIYPLCFLIRDDKVLMLHRSNPPNQGLWNGVGGKIMPGESPLHACLREVCEETGYVLDDHAVRFAGLLTWKGFEIAPGGLFIFSANAPEIEPSPNGEGRLEWKDPAWIQATDQVVSNIQVFLPHILSGKPPRWFHFSYQGGVMMSHENLPLPAWACSAFIQTGRVVN